MHGGLLVVCIDDTNALGDATVVNGVDMAPAEAEDGFDTLIFQRPRHQAAPQ